MNVMTIASVLGTPTASKQFDNHNGDGTGFIHPS